MDFSSFFLGPLAQHPLQAGHLASSEMASTVAPISVTRRLNPHYAIKEGHDVFSPKDNIALLRAGSATVNNAGDLFFVSLRQKPSAWIHISSIEDPDNAVRMPMDRSGEVFWLDDRTLGQVVGNQDSKSNEIFAISVHLDTDEGSWSLSTSDTPHLVGSLPLGTQNFVYNLAAEMLIFSARVYDDFDLYTVKEHDRAWESRGDSALVYDSDDFAFMRHVDAWRTPKRSSLFMVQLKRESSAWVLGGTVHTPLKGTGHYAPSEPYGGAEDFDVSAKSLVYTTKAPSLPAALHTKQNIYLINLKSAENPRELTSGTHGSARAPKFNSNGDKVAWLEQADDGNEAARTYVVVYDLAKDIRYVLGGTWDRSADSLAFAPGDQVLYVTAADNARGKVFILPMPNSLDPHQTTLSDPLALTTNGTASAITPLSDGRVVFMRSSFTTPNDVFILESEHSDRSLVNSGTRERRLTDFYKVALAGKSLHAGEDIRWTGGAVADRELQGWVFLPPGFKRGEKKKWPAILMIHGGPHVNWQDIWFPRYNLNVYANQGYVIFAPNPTGSTSFGQALTDAIAEDWGGAPFIDMRAGWTEFLKRYPEVDDSRTAAWGASWGGYAINWLAGHPEYNFGFKALVNKCGIFDLTAFGRSTDETALYTHAVGGFPWMKHALELSERMSPANYVAQWSTPMLLIHGSKDFAIVDAEAIGAFNALQQRGVPGRLVVFPDENHYVMKPSNTLKYNFEIFRWLDEFIGAGSVQATT